MAIEFNCPACQSRIRTPDDSGGKMARCPHCGAVAAIPGGSAAAPAAPTPASGGQPPPQPDLRANPPAKLPPAYAPQPQSSQYAPATNSFGPAPPEPANPFRDQQVNPYAPPSGVSYGPPGTLSIERARSKLLLPAIGLIGTAILGLIFLGLILIGATIDPEFQDTVPNDPAEQAGFYFAIGAIVIGGFLVHAVQILGAIAMLRMRGRGLALAGTLISVLPCNVYCCWLTLPFAIWAGIVLNSPEVRGAFQ